VADRAAQELAQQAQQPSVKEVAAYLAHHPTALGFVQTRLAYPRARGVTLSTQFHVLTAVAELVTHGLAEPLLRLNQRVRPERSNPLL
jgi:hypothetical protein